MKARLNHLVRSAERNIDLFFTGVREIRKDENVRDLVESEIYKKMKSKWYSNPALNWTVLLLMILGTLSNDEMTRNTFCIIWIATIMMFLSVCYVLGVRRSVKLLKVGFI